jgi:hypothetical protein
MPNNALLYRKPSKWPIGAAVTAAVLTHLSAVAIAFHQESPSILPEASVIPFWTTPPFLLFAAGVSNQERPRGFASRSLSC